MAWLKALQVSKVGKMTKISSPHTGGELPAAPALPGLDDYRLALGTAGHGQWTARAEPLSLVVQSVDSGTVGKNALLPVQQQGIIFPGVPQSEDNLHQFIRLVVAGIVVQVLGQPEILGFGVVERSHHVPSDASAGHPVQRDAKRRAMWNGG